MERNEENGAGSVQFGASTDNATPPATLVQTNGSTSATSSTVADEPRVLPFLDRNTIFAAQDIVTEDVDVPEWGGKVRVKGITSGERDRLEASCMVKDPANPKREKFSTLNFRAKLVVLSVVNDKGERVFQDGDSAMLAAKAAAPVTKIAEVAMKLAKISDADVEEIAKNFEAAQDDAL